MPAQQTQQVVQVVEYERRWVEAINRGDLSMAEETFAPDCVIHITGSPGPDLDVAGFKQMVTAMLAAFPDLHFTIDDQIVGQDKVAYRWTAEGTNTGPFFGGPPTGKQVRIGGVIFDQLAGGRVAERWEQWDQPAMMRQLGLA